MEVTSYPSCSHLKLRAYQYASLLASDVFWITRRFPQEEKPALTQQLRRTTQTIPLSVTRSWNMRYHAPSFRRHLDEAQSACARLGLWLHVAHDYGYLTGDEHERLQARKTHLQRMLTRLHNQRITLLA